MSLQGNEQKQTAEGKRIRLIKESLYRRILGGALGTGLGLAYSLVTENINEILLEGIPLYHKLELGEALILWGAVGVVMGLISAWPNEGIKGVILSCLLGGAAIWGLSLPTVAGDRRLLLTQLMAMVYLFLPICAILLPFIAVQRWAVDKLVTLRIDYPKSNSRIIIPSLLILASILLGAFEAYPEHGQEMVRRTHALLQEAQKANELTEIPAPFKSYRLGDFTQHGKGQYTLEWSDKINLDKYGLALPTVSRSFEQSAVIVRFDNGWKILCAFSNADVEPVCIELESNP